MEIQKGRKDVTKKHFLQRKTFVRTFENEKNLYPSSSVKKSFIFVFAGIHATLIICVYVICGLIILGHIHYPRVFSYISR